MPEFTSEILPETAKGRAQRKQAESREKRRQALELRKAGVEYERIAQQVGYNSKQAVYAAVKAALKDITREPAQEVKDLELARLDAVQLSIWNQVRSGDLQAIDRFLKIQHQRAQLLGLYSHDEVEKDYRQWLQKNGYDDAAVFNGLIGHFATQRQNAAAPVGEDGTGRGSADSPAERGDGDPAPDAPRGSV